MPLFYWRGIDISGSRRSGYAFSASYEALHSFLESRAIVLTYAYQPRLVPTIRGAQKEAFFEQLTTLMGAHIPLYESLGIIAQTTHSSYIKAVIEDIARHVAQGGSLAEILEMHQLLDPFSKTLIRVGEKTGSLVALLEVLVSHYQQMARITDQMKQTLFMPALTGALFFVVAGGSLMFVVPQFREYFRMFEVELPPITQGILILSDALTLVRILWGVCLGLGCILGIKAIGHTAFGQDVKDSILDMIPIIGSLRREKSHAHIVQVLALLVTHRVPLAEALQTCTLITDHKGYQSELRKIAANVQEGQSLLSAWQSSSLAHPEIDRLIGMGESTGHLGKMLAYAAELAHKRFFKRMKRLSSLLQPAVLLLLALFIAALLGALYMPLITLSVLI